MGKNTVVLGITGCIAAYKAAEIVRRLQDEGVCVKVIMTEHACEFIGPTTFRALTHEPVAVGLFDDPQDPIHHISLAQAADAFVIAPCTANVMAKLAHGIADDLLTTTALATTAPLLIAPAMNVNMYNNPLTQKNREILIRQGAEFVSADEGYLACGDVGKGRLAEVESIVAKTMQLLGIKKDLEGKKVMITAGPTVEAIDPVRFISNHSTGKMGYALASSAAERGAEVVLISGPTNLKPPEGILEYIGVVSADEMLQVAQTYFRSSDIAIFSAAVSDLRPVKQASQKLKKGQDDQALTSLELVENPDILSSLAHEKTRQIVIGFAAETENIIKNAQEKLSKKNADFIIANDVSGDVGFGSDNNKIWVVSPTGCVDVPLAPKNELADIILDEALASL